MSTLDLTPILNSPRLPDIVAALTDHLRAESEMRHCFREEMSEGQKVEFIEGSVVLHSPALNRHMAAQFKLAKLMDTHADRHELGLVRYEKCLCVFPRNDYEPDVSFFGREKAAGVGPETMLFPIPDLVVEVLSDSTAHRDRGVKFEDYEAHGVAEYWIVDAETETIEQYVGNNGHFELVLKSGSGEIASRAIAGFRIPIRAVFDVAENLKALRNLLD
jgi:Uma2 family endonuclease